VLANTLDERRDRDQQENVRMLETRQDRVPVHRRRDETTDAGETHSNGGRGLGL